MNREPVGAAKTPLPQESLVSVCRSSSGPAGRQGMPLRWRRIVGISIVVFGIKSVAFWPSAPWSCPARADDGQIFVGLRKARIGLDRYPLLGDRQFSAVLIDPPAIWREMRSSSSIACVCEAVGVFLGGAGSGKLADGGDEGFEPARRRLAQQMLHFGEDLFDRVQSLRILGRKNGLAAAGRTGRRMAFPLWLPQDEPVSPPPAQTRL